MILEGVAMEEKIYTFEFANGMRLQYELPNDVTMRELIEVFIEDGLLGELAEGARYVFTPKGGRTLEADNLNMGVGAFELRPGVEYFVERYY